MPQGYGKDKKNIFLGFFLTPVELTKYH